MLALKPDRSRTVANIQRRQAAKRLRKRFRRQVRDILIMALGVISAGFGLKGFLIPNGLIDGGVMGISLLTRTQTPIPLSILIILFNIPFIFLGYHQIGKAFAVKSIVGISLLAIAIPLIPYPVVTDDKLLVAVFGGFFLGAGIGLSIRGGRCSGWN